MPLNSGLKKKIKERQLTIGSWLTIPHTAVAEIMAQQKFDWLTLDLEHSTIDYSQAQSMMAVVQGYGIPVFARVGKNDEVIIKRIMDAGADGVIVPMVNSRIDAENAVNYVRYPPVGKRGVGLARAQKYGQGFDQYKDWLENESIVIAQIEHIDGVRNVREILSVQGIDGILIGPYDLSASLGIPGQFENPKVLTAIEEVKTATLESGKALGFHVIAPKADEISKKHKEGFSFLAFSIDFLFLGEKIRMELETLKKDKT